MSEQFLTELARAEHDSTDSIKTKKSSLYAYDLSALGKRRLTSTLVGSNQALDVNVVQTVGGGADPVGLKNIAAAQINPATEDKQDDAIALLTTIESNQLPDGHNITVDNDSIAVTGTFWQATQPISAASLPLPTGASTLAEQQTQTTALQLIDNAVSGSGFNISQMNGVNVTMGNGVSGTGVQRVTIASDSTGQVAIASLPNEGQQTMANSISVAIASNQSAVPISAASGSVASGAFAAGSIATGAIVDALADDAAFTPATSRVFPSGFFVDETATDSVDEGDIGASRMTPDRKQIMASNFVDDAAWSAGKYVNVIAGVLDDTSTDYADEGDVSYIRSDAARALLANIGGTFPTFGHTTSTSVSAVQISSTPAQIRSITITALGTNIETLYIGGFGVAVSGASGGYPLRPGMSKTWYVHSNLNQWYFIKSNATSQGVSFVYST